MKLTVICPAFDASGYAEAARSIIFGLMDQGCMIRVIPKDWSQLNAGLPLQQKERLLSVCGTDILPEGPIMQMSGAQYFYRFPDRINIGITMLECDRLPLTWVEKCNQMDQIWVPSLFNRQTFTKSGVKGEKIRVIPLGVDTDRFHPVVPPMKVDKIEGRFVFISNFEWVPRKGYDLLLRAYLQEFTQSDPVALVIKTYDGSDYDPAGIKMHHEWSALIKEMKVTNPPALTFITTGMTYDELPSFYTTGDCYIIPTRGEGWNLPALEAMSSAIPVITTNWSAHLDFLRDENSYMIGVERLELIPRFGIPNDEIYHGSQWAVPSLSDIRRWMRHAVEHPEEVKQKGKQAREHVSLQWSTVKMIERISALLNACGGRTR